MTSLIKSGFHCTNFHITQNHVPFSKADKTKKCMQNVISALEV
jgi:hypothetical protein